MMEMLDALSQNWINLGPERMHFLAVFARKLTFAILSLLTCVHGLIYCITMRGKHQHSTADDCIRRGPIQFLTLYNSGITVVDQSNMLGYFTRFISSMKQWYLLSLGNDTYPYVVLRFWMKTGSSRAACSPHCPVKLPKVNI